MEHDNDRILDGEEHDNTYIFDLFGLFQIWTETLSFPAGSNIGEDMAVMAAL